jgi:hypothetical protein
LWKTSAIINAKEWQLNKSLTKTATQAPLDEQATHLIKTISVEKTRNTSADSGYAIEMVQRTNEKLLVRFINPNVFSDTAADIEPNVTAVGLMNWTDVHVAWSVRGVFEDEDDIRTSFVLEALKFALKIYKNILKDFEKIARNNEWRITLGL